MTSLKKVEKKIKTAVYRTVLCNMFPRVTESTADATGRMMQPGYEMSKHEKLIIIFAT